MSAGLEHAQKVRAFLRAQVKLDGALEALDALEALEKLADDTQGQKARELAFSKAIVAAQDEIKSAMKDTTVKLKTGGSYDVAETEQLLELMREVNGVYRIALEPGDAEAFALEGRPFMRVGLGLRHEDGYVRMTKRDFPVDNASSIGWRQTHTAALGYFIRDAFALPRKKDEGEAAQARRASGPRQAGGGTHEETRQRPAVDPTQRDSGPAKKVTPWTEVLERAKNAPDLSKLEIAEMWLDGQEYDLTQGVCPYEEKQLDDIKAALRKRRTELTGGKK